MLQATATSASGAPCRSCIVAVIRSVPPVVTLAEAALTARLPGMPVPIQNWIGSVRPSLRMTESPRSEEHTSELQSQSNLVCRLLLEKKKKSTKHRLSRRMKYRHTTTSPTLSFYLEQPRTPRRKARAHTTKRHAPKRRPPRCHCHGRA